MIRFAYDRRLDDRFVPNGLGEESPFYERFLKRVQEYDSGYCRGPLLHLLAESGCAFEERLLDEWSPEVGPIIYPLEMLYSFPVWLKRLESGKEFARPPWGFISANALERIRRGQCFLLVTHLKKPERDTAPFQVFDQLHQKMRDLGVPPEQVIYVDCLENTPDDYARFLAENPQETPFHWVTSLSYFEAGWLTYDRHYLAAGKTFTLAEARIAREKKRPHRFLCFNREVRAHRLLTAIHLAKNGWLERGLVSFPHESPGFAFNQFDSYEEGVRDQFSDPRLLALLGEAELLRARLPLKVDHRDVREIKISHCTKAPFRDTYFSLITERVYHTRSGQRLLTSKFFKAASNMHPFVAIGAAGILEDFRNKGYRSFAPFIDESYDLERDPNRRLRLCWREFEHLCSMPDDEIHSWYHAMFEILEHNWLHLQKRRRAGLGRVFSDELIERITPRPQGALSWIARRLESLRGRRVGEEVG